MRTDVGPFSLLVCVSAVAVGRCDAGRLRIRASLPGAGAKRDARLLAWGFAATAAFVVLRGIGVYGEPNPWQVQGSAVATVIDFLNVTKYPPSLLFLLMTLGPAAMVCASAGRVPDAIKQPLIVFGRAPFAFYVAHLYLIHALAVAFGVIQGFGAGQFLTYSFFFPKGYGVGLPGVYVGVAVGGRSSLPAL